jgi:hypothetical protein
MNVARLLAAMLLLRGRAAQSRGVVAIASSLP